MNPPDAPNPERKSDAAILCFCIGGGLCALSWFLGVGGVLAAAFSGNDAAVAAGGVGMLIALPLATIAGLILMTVGGVWMLGRVIADQTGGAEEKRYRDVER